MSKALRLTLPTVTRAFAELDTNFVWNKRTEFERVIPTLTDLSVPVQKRGKGHGVALVYEVLAFMKQNKIRAVAFNNFNKDFWAAFAKHDPKHIAFYDRKRYIGILRLSDKTHPDQIFE